MAAVRAGIGGAPVVAFELVGMDSILNKIGFANEEERLAIMEAGIGNFEDFRYLVEKDIRDMLAVEFGERTVANGRVVFGLGRTKKLTGVMHWVQDCFRASDVPNHNNFDEAALYQALSLAQVRKLDIELVTTNSKAADPGKFKDERKWPKWEKLFINYLSVIPGANGIPLSYVMREVDASDDDIDYATFNERLLAEPHWQDSILWRMPGKFASY